MITHQQRILAITGAALAALTFGTPAIVAQTSTPRSTESSDGSSYSTRHGDNTSTSDSSKLKHSDRSFIERAAKMNSEEVEISRIVAQNATNAQVRELASDMVSAHEKVGSELQTLAAKKGVTISTDTDSLKKWTNKKAGELEEDYLKTMRSAHKSMIDLFEKGAKSEDAEIASFANSHLPDLHTHYVKVDGMKFDKRSGVVNAE
ncbi:MAG: DUF4142 domain-containing protein [Nibricoccus sp.]